MSDRLSPVDVVAENVYPTDIEDKSADCHIDLDAIRRIALRAPPMGDPLSARANTLMLQMDALIEHNLVGRALVVAQALTEAARIDSAVVEIIRRSQLTAQIRAEVLERKAAQASTPMSPIVGRARLMAPVGTGPAHG